MAGYLGPQPVPQALRKDGSITATAGQTTFSTAGYTPDYVDVYVNGVKLAKADFTASNGTDIVLASGANANDIVSWIAYVPFESGVITQSPTDATAGRMLKVGDGGINVAISLGASDNLNDLRGSGLYYNPTQSNTPGNNYPLSAAGSLLQIDRSDINRTQLFTVYGTHATYVRSRDVAGWSAWDRLLLASDKTTSATDTTAGRLLTTSSFGLGDSTPVVSGANALDTHLFGRVRVTSANVPTVNGPSGANGGVIEAYYYAADNVMQVYHEIAGPGRAYYRHKSVTWTAWKQILSDVDKTTSTTDRTEGKLLRVSDFGIGGAGDPPTITDFNASIVPGFYKCLGSNQTGGPETLAWQASVLVTRGVLGYTGFLYFRHATASPKVWHGIRTSDTGAVTWSQFYNDKNTVGTVSQSGGYPTGAVIERGSNSNGEYVRFADGTQICKSQSLNGSTTADTTWNYPASFVATPDIVPGNTTFEDRIITRGSTSTSTTTASLRIHAVNGSRSTTAFSVVAIGRWF